MSNLCVKNIVKKINGISVVNDISFSIESGEIVGLVGPNGSGKTTTLKCITGLIKPFQGKILIDNFDIQTDFKKAITRIGSLIEAPSLYPNLSGEDNLRLTCRVYQPSEAYYKELIAFADLGCYLRKPVARYSLGMKQRLGICIALLSQPGILLLDEPLNGLDIEGIAAFRTMIKKLAKEKGTAVLISSHMLSELKKTCTKVILLNRGKQRATIDDLTSCEDLEQIYFEQGEDA